MTLSQSSTNQPTVTSCLAIDGGEIAADPGKLRYSAIIPVYNSASIVGETIERTVRFFANNNLDYEIVLVNDGSRDNSWEVVRQKALANQDIIAINLLRNYGQHSAVFCGFKHCTGDFVITLDDDLQNPPEEIIHLIQKAEEGYDLVFGQFRRKEHAGYRRMGSHVVGWFNDKIFHKPDNLVLSNFRIVRRDVVERICAYRTGYPYIPGLALMFASNPANVWVEHHSRPVGKSNYNWLKIAELVLRILFNYSSYPLRFVSIGGIIIAVMSFLMSMYYLFRAVFVGFGVPGWATVIVMLSFFNGMIILMLGMLGEYTVRLLNQMSSDQSYYIKDAVGRGK